METSVHQKFVSEAMDAKFVEELAGIGVTYGERLRIKGFIFAKMVFGVFLVQRRSQLSFIVWLDGLANVQKQHADNCFNCLRVWESRHFRRRAFDGAALEDKLLTDLPGIDDVLDSRLRSYREKSVWSWASQVESLFGQFLCDGDEIVFDARFEMACGATVAQRTTVISCFKSWSQIM